MGHFYPDKVNNGVSLIDSAIRHIDNAVSNVNTCNYYMYYKIRNRLYYNLNNCSNTISGYKTSTANVKRNINNVITQYNQILRKTSSNSIKTSEIDMSAFNSILSNDFQPSGSLLENGFNTVMAIESKKIETLMDVGEEATNMVMAGADAIVTGATILTDNISVAWHSFIGGATNVLNEAGANVVNVINSVQNTVNNVGDFFQTAFSKWYNETLCPLGAGLLNGLIATSQGIVKVGEQMIDGINTIGAASSYAQLQSNGVLDSSIHEQSWETVSADIAESVKVEHVDNFFMNVYENSEGWQYIDSLTNFKYDSDERRAYTNGVAFVGDFAINFIPGVGAPLGSLAFAGLASEETLKAGGSFTDAQIAAGTSAGLDAATAGIGSGLLRGAKVVGKVASNASSTVKSNVFEKLFARTNKKTNATELKGNAKSPAGNMSAKSTVGTKVKDISGSALSFVSGAKNTLNNLTLKLSDTGAVVLDKAKSAVMDQNLYLIHPMFNKSRRGGGKSLSSGLNQPVILNDALHNLTDFENRLVNPKVTYDSLSKIADAAKAKGNNVYETITNLSSKFQKNRPSPEVVQIFEGNVVDNAFKYPGGMFLNKKTGISNATQVDGNNNLIFYHFKTEGFKVEEETGRLYLNMSDYNNAYYFTETFMAECKKRGIDFYIKTGTPNSVRDEMIVIYVNDQNKLDCTNLCKEIRESMDYNAFDNPPIFTSTIDGFIGYGDSPINKNVSFNRQRANWIEASYNDAVDNYMIITGNVSHQDQDFLNYFYQTLLGKASKYNIDVNNFSLNTRVKTDLHNRLDRSPEFEMANRDTKEMSGSSHVSPKAVQRVPNEFISVADEIIKDTKFMELYHASDLRGFVGPRAQKLERLERQILDDTGLSEAFRINDNYGLANGADNYSDRIIKAYENGGWKAVEAHIPRNGESGINPRRIFEQYSADELGIAHKLYNERNTRMDVSRMGMYSASGVKGMKNKNANSRIETGHDSRLRLSEEELHLRKQKIDDLKTSLSDMGAITPENKSIFDALLKNLEEGVKLDFTFEKLLLNLDAIFKHSPDFRMFLVDNSFGGGYNFVLDQYSLGRNLSDFSNGDRLSFTALHELGHTFFNKFKGVRQEMDLGFLGTQEYFGVVPNKKMTNIVQNAQKIMQSNDSEVIQYLSKNDESWNNVREEAKRRFSLIKEAEAERIGQNVDEIFDSDNSYKLESMLRKAGISNDRIEALMGNPEKLKEVLVKTNELDIIELLHDDIANLSEANLGKTNLDAMLNSIIQSEKYGDINFKYFHSDEYWIRKDEIDGACRDSYDELMADYFAFKGFGRDDLIDDLRTLAGDELVDSLEEEYSEILGILDSNGLIAR